MWKTANILYNIIGVGFGIIGLAGANDDIKVWQYEWLPMLNLELWVSIGLLISAPFICFAPWLWPLVHRKLERNRLSAKQPAKLSPERLEESQTTLPKTETWIKSEVLEIIVQHPLVFKNSNRRKLQGKHMIEEIQESLRGPSGEAIYTRKEDRASARRYLNEIITRHPQAKRGDEYSKEIIEYELDEMIRKKKHL